MINRPNRKKRMEWRLIQKDKRRKGLTGLGTAQTVLTKENTNFPTIKVPRHKKRSGLAEYQQLTKFDAELLRRCRNKGMSDEEIRKWMEEF